jgi:hypothetical protein
MGIHSQLTAIHENRNVHRIHATEQVRQAAGSAKHPIRRHPDRALTATREMTPTAPAVIQTGTPPGLTARCCRTTGVRCVKTRVPSSSWRCRCRSPGAVLDHTSTAPGCLSPPRGASLAILSRHARPKPPLCGYPACSRSAWSARDGYPIFRICALSFDIDPIMRILYMPTPHVRTPPVPGGVPVGAGGASPSRRRFASSSTKPPLRVLAAVMETADPVPVRRESPVWGAAESRLSRVATA